MSKPADGVKASTKSELFAELAAATELTKKQVQAVFEALVEKVKKDLGKKGPKVLTIPGLLKLKLAHKPATKARKGINPFTKEEMVYKAKPARNVVKALPLKSLKDMIA